MGGAERLAKHHGKGKLDARARIEHLLDKGSFREFGTLVGGEIAADGIVAGSGLVNGSPVMVGAEDFTTLAGSIGPGGNSKRYRHRRTGAARQDSAGDAAGGCRFPAQRRALRPHPHRPARAGTVLGQGPDRRRGARPVGRARRARRAGVRLPHHEPPGRDLHGRPPGRQRVHGRGDFEGGPRRTRRRAGQRGDPQRRRGRRSRARRHPPLPVLLPAERVVVPVAAARRRDQRSHGRRPSCSTSCSRDNRRVYDMRAVLDVVFDRPDWFEVQPKFGQAIICALAHLGGHPVAVVANQPKVMAGSIDADAADKAAHFIMVADSFHLPIVFLADNPGMLPGSRSETQRRAAQRRTDVRRADRGHHAEAARDAAQGVRVRLDGHVAAGFRQSERDVRLPGRDDGRDERGGAEPGLACRRGRRGQAARRRGGGVLPLGRAPRLRRADRPARDPRRAAGGAAARPLQQAGRRRTGEPHRHHAVPIGRRGYPVAGRRRRSARVRRGSRRA